MLHRTDTMKKRRRVVITGLGAVTSIGSGIKEFSHALRNGKNGASAVTSFSTTGFSCDVGCEVHGFDPRRWIHTLDYRDLGRSSQFSIAATYMALEDAGIEKRSISQERCGICIGTTDGEAMLFDTFTNIWIHEGPEHLSSNLVRSLPADRLSVSVAQEFDLKGEAVTIATACAAGNYSIGHAYDQICLGEADFMLCGGADSMCRKNFAGFYRLGALAPQVCQPFDKNRKGILTGEGAGVLLLESLESAVSRGARIYAEVLGYGLNCDAEHIMAPDKNGIVECMHRAHENAGIRPSQVDYICAHGTGTQANDITEVSAIREVFVPNIPPISSIKSMLGHTMGAASALAGIACALGIYEGFMPPTINFQTPDPECNIDCVPNKERKVDLNIVQNNAFAFGGNNAIVIFGKYD